MKLHIYFRHFYLKLRHSSNFFAHTLKLLSREKSMQKSLPFGFSESHITSVFIVVCSFLTPPLPPKKISLWHSSIHTAQLLFSISRGQCSHKQLSYFTSKKELFFIVSWLKGSHSTTIFHKNAPCLCTPLQMSNRSETNKIIFCLSFF